MKYQDILIPLLGYSPPIWATIIATAFVMLTLCLSFFLLFEHLSAYKNPEVIFPFFGVYFCCLLGFGSTKSQLTSTLFFLSGAKVFNWSYPYGSLLCHWICEWSNLNLAAKTFFIVFLITWYRHPFSIFPNCCQEIGQLKGWNSSREHFNFAFFKTFISFCNFHF